MLLNLFNELRAAKVPVSLRELLDLLEALERQVVFADMDAFYYLARTVLVKDERHFDKFDRAFASYFNGLQSLDAALEALIPEDWLRKEFERLLSAEDKAQLKSLGGLDQLLEAFKQRLAEQKERHAGGNKWIGTGGTSPFGSGGYHPEGIRVGDAGQRQGRAAKVWEQREYRNLDDQMELGSRNIQLALRRLRKFAREGAAEEFDLDGTIEHTARDAGLLNIRMRPERRNAVKLLLLFDIGGSMDSHVKVCEELFSACRTEFKHLEYFYFHNFIYEGVWRDNQR
ncbi:MAG: VWA domain-containing protein, partial [Pseudomonas sagittaria]|nr:VWA domain-containing protein [Pseudomonas sagittaria]